MKSDSAAAPAGLARRSFLTGLAVTLPVTAMATTAARAGSQAASEIDHLIALRDRWRHLESQTLVFEDRVAKLEEAYFAVVNVAPLQLKIRKADFRLLKEFGSVRRWQSQTHFSAADVKEMRRRKAMRYFIRIIAIGTPGKYRDAAPDVEPIGTLGIDYDEHHGRKPWPLAQKRKDNIVAAYDRWQADKGTLRASMGVDDAEEALETHQHLVDDAVKAIVSASASTAQALKFKAGLMTEWTNNEDPFEDWRKVELMTALLEDISKLDFANV